MRFVPDDRTREEAIREYVAYGMTDPAIARALGVDPRTVLRWRQRLGLPSPYAPPEAEHGNHTRYRKGCRCPKCRAYNRAAQAEYRNAQQALTVPRATRVHVPWDPEEDQVLLAEDGTTLRSKALRLGRTYSAVANRLHVLRHRGDV